MENSDVVSASGKGPWKLPVEGWEILTVIFAFQLDIVAYGEGPVCRIRLAGAFTLTESDGVTHELDAERRPWEELTPLLSLRHDTLASVIASDDAQLLVTFGSGRSLSAAADGRPYEHWEASAPGLRLIAMPGDGGDGVAVFEDV